MTTPPEPAPASAKRPPKIKDVMAYWADPPPERSARCQWWLEQFAEGWRPNQRICRMGYHTSAEFYGVHLWEYLNVLSPALRAWEVWDKAVTEFRREVADMLAGKPVSPKFEAAYFSPVPLTFIRIDIPIQIPGGEVVTLTVPTPREAAESE